ncbi:MAG TPA: PAS domain S-box protein [Rhodocyclaceae bacterium]|nr:PAS domain S-box protein [Rhodocyclaceae bacterium]
MSLSREAFPAPATAAALQQSELKLQLLMEHSPAMIAVFDRDMRYLAASRRWLTDLGLGDRNIIGLSHYEIFPDLPEAWKDAHRSGLAGSVRLADADRFERPDGTVQWVRWELWPWHDAAGAVGGIVIAAEDITDLKHSQEALYRSQVRFQALFEQAAVGIARVALDGTWLEVNDALCAIVGYEREEMLKMGFPDITHTPDLAADLTLYEKLMAGQIPSYTLEKRYIRKDGSLVWVNLTGSLVRDSCGEPDYFIAVVEDIHDRKEAEAALENARKVHLEHLEQLVAERTAALQEAHDLLEQRVAERTVQVRRLAAEVTFAEERERQALARDLHDGLVQLLHVAKLKLGLLGREALPPRGKALAGDLGSIVGDACREARSLTSQLSPPVLSTLGLPAALRWLCGEIHESYGLEVVCGAEIADPGISPSQSAILFRAARELLINAAKHSGSRTAAVDLFREDDAVVMAVEDAGRGIRTPEEALAGTKGFGLASVRERMHFLGGSMDLDFPPGGGLRIVLRMPVNLAVRTKAPTQ